MGESQSLLSDLSLPTTTLLKIHGSQTFTCFRSLPAELRIKIWEDCLPHQVHLCHERGNDGDDYEDFHHTGCKKEHDVGVKSSQLPIISRVCFEARQLVLQKYSMRKTLVTMDGESRLGGQLHEARDVWVNMERDTVFINLAKPIYGDEFPDQYDDTDTVSDVYLLGLIREKKIPVAVVWQSLGDSEPLLTLDLYEKHIEGLEKCDLGIMEI